MGERKFWGGFVSGKLDTINVDTGWGGFGSWADMPAIFRTRKEARQRYEDVRRVTVAAPESAGE